MRRPKPTSLALYTQRHTLSANSPQKSPSPHPSPCRESPQRLGAEPQHSGHSGATRVPLENRDDDVAPHAAADRALDDALRGGCDASSPRSLPPSAAPRLSAAPRPAPVFTPAPACSARQLTKPPPATRSPRASRNRYSPWTAALNFPPHAEKRPPPLTSLASRGAQPEHLTPHNIEPTHAVVYYPERPVPGSSPSPSSHHGSSQQEHRSPNLSPPGLSPRGQQRSPPSPPPSPLSARLHARLSSKTSGARGLIRSSPISPSMLAATGRHQYGSPISRESPPPPSPPWPPAASKRKPQSPAIGWRAAPTRVAWQHVVVRTASLCPEVEVGSEWRAHTSSHDVDSCLDAPDRAVRVPRVVHDW